MTVKECGQKPMSPEQKDIDPTENQGGKRERKKHGTAVFQQIIVVIMEEG